MTEPSSDENDRNFGLPFLWHESEFDVAADLGYKDATPVGIFTRCEHIHFQTDFDCSQRVEEDGAVALRLTFHLHDAETSPSLARDVLELLYALHEYDKALDGHGLGLNRAASRADAGQLSLVLRPNDQHGAVDRFRQMAKQLGCPIIIADFPEAPSDPISTSILADVTSLWEQTEFQQRQGASEALDLTIPRDRVGRYRVQFALVFCAA